KRDIVIPEGFGELFGKLLLCFGGDGLSADKCYFKGFCISGERSAFGNSKRIVYYLFDRGLYFGVVNISLIGISQLCTTAEVNIELYAEGRNKHKYDSDNEESRVNYKNGLEYPVE